MKYLSDNDLLVLEREVAFILDNARLPGCPDPGGGGCIGNHCIYCAARMIKGTLQEVRRR